MPITLLAKLKTVPGAADLRIQQAFDYPQFNVNVNRTNASQVGLTQQQVANDVLISLSGSQQTAPTFWVDPKSGVQYSVTTQAPQYRLTSLQDLAVDADHQRQRRLAAVAGQPRHHQPRRRPGGRQPLQCAVR